MPHGTLEVLLLGAKDIENTDFFSNMDPYAIITCLTQEKRSSVASGKGTTPEWNETFLFTISDDVSELRIKIMDSDNLTQDDFVGEATIPLESLFHEGSIPPTSYNVTKDEQYCGEIRVGLTFTRQNCGGVFIMCQQEKLSFLGMLNMWGEQQHQRRRTTLANHPADVAVEEGAKFILVLSLSEEFLAKFISKFRDDAAKLLVAYKVMAGSGCSVFARNLPLGAMAALEPKLETNFGFDGGLP
ncbi:hypothetical protein HYC85_016538 [Camellia sinensis]|uniref:C2 domain-containing protein n=1 Tax=Camellia sinensis TaxID=4442 RepID=A0A7J7H044_CAMSI|nr:hypothetical protein HYC85_016538 [Camellia sinensis]